MSEPPTFQHLGIFSDLVGHVGAVGTAKEGGLLTGDLRKRIRNLLSVEPAPPQPEDVRVERTLGAPRFTR
jgi:hypothetical protein